MKTTAEIKNQKRRDPTQDTLDLLSTYLELNDEVTSTHSDKDPLQRTLEALIGRLNASQRDHQQQDGEPEPSPDSDA